jgi:hypothetical protein
MGISMGIMEISMGAMEISMGNDDGGNESRPPFWDCPYKPGSYWQPWF